LVLAGGAAAIAFFAGKSAEAEKRQEELAGAGKNVAAAIREQDGAINGAVRAAAAKEAEDQGLLEKAQQLGIALPAVTDAILGQGGAMEGLRTKLQGIIAAETIHQQTAGKGSSVRIDSLTAEGHAAQNMLNDLNALTGGKESNVAATQREVAATQSLGAAHTVGTSSADLYKAAIERAGIEFDESAGLAEQLKAAIDALTAAEMAQIDTLESYEAAQDALTSSVEANGRTLNIHTEAGRKNRDALEDVAKKSRDLMQADIDSGVPMNQALARHNQRIAALKNEATKTFGAKSEAVKLINTYSKVPKDVRTAIRTQGYEEANRRMMDLSAKQTALEHGVTIGSKGYQAYVRQINKEKSFQRAAGGPVFGPGTSTSDSIPGWLSNNEHVWTAREVDAAGGHRAVMGLRMAALKGELPAFAKGGAVTWPFNVNLRKTKIPEFVPAFVGGSAVAGSPAVVAAVRAAASRYGWGSGGQWNALSRLITGESGWNPNAQNPTSTAYGLFQFLNSTWAGTGFAKSSSPAVQAAAGMVYIRSRYGSPAAAYGAWSSRSPHWYDDGGSLRPGVSTVVNNTGRPEQVLTPREREAFIAQARAAAAGDGKPTVVKNFNLHAHVTNHPVDLVNEFRRMELLEGMP
jgi:hypothetical protein